MKDSIHRLFMLRALRLASNGGTAVKLNPQVGCVIVYDNRIIGEGYHAAYGQNHAEINALESVKEEDRQFLKEATVYVTLEPCSHYGKTPPCSKALIETGIKRIYIGCQDPNIKVAGAGIEMLKNHGIEVISPFMEEECLQLIEKFTTHLEKRRPYICLKWAQSFDGYIGEEGKQTAISGEKTQFHVHKWRAEFQAILVGSGTVLTDNPGLDNRLAPGSSPDRVILDRRQRLTGKERVFREDDNTVYYCTINKHNNNIPEHVKQLILPEENFLPTMLAALYADRIGSLFVEGGAEIHQSFIDASLYDEIRLIENNRRLGSRIKAPKFHGRIKEVLEVGNDRILFMS